MEFQDNAKTDRILRDAVGAGMADTLLTEMSAVAQNRGVAQKDK